MGDFHSTILSYFSTIYLLLPKYSLTLYNTAIFYDFKAINFVS